MLSYITLDGLSWKLGRRVEVLMRNMGRIMLILIGACQIPDEQFITGDDGSTAVAVPRLIAPLSMSTVTQQQPMLHWVLGPGDGVPVVDLCRDRSCTMQVPVTTQLASDHLSAVPLAALPSGWVYWRVRVVVGTQTVSSATWQFLVGTSSASNPVDTSNGTILDVNGDGYADLLVGDSGAAHLYLGSATASATGWNGASPPERIDLTNNTGGFGNSVASAGDVNGDGYADFLVGAEFENNGSGAAHLYLGSVAPSTIAWNGTSPTDRIDLIGPDGARTVFGHAVASIGDVNGDGYADFLICAPDANAGSGAVHLYLGSAAPNATAWNGISPTGRIELAIPKGSSGGFGVSVASAGDVNGDGYADFLVGTDGAAAYLYLGAATLNGNGASPMGRIDLASPEGVSAGFGVSVASAGDINGDGYADFLVGVYDPSSGTEAAHLYLGAAVPSATAWNGASAPARIELATPDGANAAFGSSVASVGDVNGDGYVDFLVGAPGTISFAGVRAAHLYLGAAIPSVTIWNGPSPTGRIDLASPDGMSALFSLSILGGGDVNGDGYTDFLVDSPDVIPGSPGSAHVYLGSAILSATAWNGASATQRIDLVPTTQMPISAARW